MAGFGRPEDTVETLLWAIEKGDTATLMQAFSPEAEKGIQEQFERAAGGAEEVFRQMRIVPGMAIAAKRSVDNNAVELDVIIIPGDPPQQIRMRFIDGQWRLLAF